MLGSLALSRGERSRAGHVGAKDCGPLCGVEGLLWSSEPSLPPTCHAQEHQALLRNMMYADLSLELKAASAVVTATLGVITPEPVLLVADMCGVVAFAIFV